MGIRGPADSEVYAYLAGLERGEDLDRSAPSGITMGSLGYGAGGPVWLDAFKSKRPPAPFELVDSYKAIAYACIQLNANGVSRVALRLYAKTGRKDARPRRDCRAVSLQDQRRLRKLPYLARSLGPDDEIDEIVEHPFLDALDCPNPYFDGVLFTTFMAVSLDVVGTFYFVPERPDPSYAARTWWPLQAQYVFPVKGTGTTPLRSYRYFGDDYTPDQVVRIRRLSMRDPYLSAFSPLHACFEQVGLGDYYTGVVESMLKGGARPEMTVGPADPAMPFGDEEAKVFEKDINNRFKGGNSGRVWVLKRPYKIDLLSYPPADLAGLEVTKWERLLVANCFDVPISLLQAEDTNRAVASEGTHQHQYYAIEPRCRLIAAALTSQLCTPINPRLFFAYDSAVQRDIERDARVWDMRLKNGSAIINEYRAEESEPPVDWGDEPWLANSLVQPSTAEEQREQQANVQTKQLEQAAKQAKKLDEGEEPDPAKKEDAKDAEERSRLSGRLDAALDQLERALAHAGSRGDHPGTVGAPPVEPTAGGPAGSARGQHVPTAAWDADQATVGEVVPDPGGARPGHDADDRSPAAQELPEPE